MTRITIQDNFTGIIYKQQCTESWPYHVVIIQGTDGVVYQDTYHVLEHAEISLDKQLNRLKPMGRV